jgi:hypothetical protein
MKWTAMKLSTIRLSEFNWHRFGVDFSTFLFFL